jgi:DNA (cytosine-5)-methyltransferase 3A
MITNNILSTFDGISAGQIALNELNIGYNTYYASEIDKDAIKVTQNHYPKTVQLGDVRYIDGHTLNNIKLIMGGSPCTDFTIMGKRHGMSTNTNIHVTSLNQYLELKNDNFELYGQSYLFFEFVRLWKETNAKYFFLENVANMDKKWIDIISDIMGVLPVRINSSLLTAQNRDRLYWTNIPNTSIPDDKNIFLSNVIPDAVSGAGYRGIPIKNDSKPDGRLYYKPKLSVRKDFKANCITTGTTTTYYQEETGNIKPLSIEEIEVLQGLQKGYTNINSISNTKRIKLVGNSWTIDVIKHLFQGLKTKKNKYNLFFR